MFQKVYLFFSILMVIVTAFLSGVTLVKHDYHDLLFDAPLVLIWTLALLASHLSIITDELFGLLDNLHELIRKEVKNATDSTNNKAS